MTKELYGEDAQLKGLADASEAAQEASDPICAVCREPKSVHVPGELGPLTHPRQARGEGRYVHHFGTSHRGLMCGACGGPCEGHEWERWDFAATSEVHPVCSSCGRPYGYRSAPADFCEDTDGESCLKIQLKRKTESAAFYEQQFNHERTEVNRLAARVKELELGNAIKELNQRLFGCQGAAT